MTVRLRNMSLYPRNMAKVMSGDKTIEVRVAYPNYRDLAEGQQIRFLSGEDSCLTRVLRVSSYPSFEALLDSEDPAAIGYDVGLSRDEMLARLRDIYPAHKEALGVLAIEIRREPLAQ